MVNVHGSAGHQQGYAVGELKFKAYVVSCFIGERYKTDWGVGYEQIAVGYLADALFKRALPGGVVHSKLNCLNIALPIVNASNSVRAMNVGGGEQDTNRTCVGFDCRDFGVVELKCGIHCAWTCTDACYEA